MSNYQPVLIEGRTIIPACDVDFARFDKIIRTTADLPKIGAYKIPARAGRKGWERWVETARKYTRKPLIYDHQKAGNDPPHTAKGFMKDVKQSGFDAVILYPFAGPVSQIAWTEEAMKQDLTAIIGGRMTHEQSIASENGYIEDISPERIYRLAARQGIRHFVVPANYPLLITKYRKVFEEEKVEDPILFAVGIGEQGGEISEVAKVAGNSWHAIVGRAIIKAPDIRKAAEELTSKL